MNPDVRSMNTCSCCRHSKSVALRWQTCWVEVGRTWVSLARRRLKGKIGDEVGRCEQRSTRFEIKIAKANGVCRMSGLICYEGGCRCESGLESWSEMGDNPNKIGWTKCTLQADVRHFSTRTMAVAGSEKISSWRQAAVGLGWEQKWKLGEGACQFNIALSLGFASRRRTRLWFMSSVLLRGSTGGAKAKCVSAG